MKSLREIRRWLTLRCELCDHRFRWKRDSRHTFGGNRAVYHEYCMGYVIWRTRAEERLEVVGVMSEVSGMTGRDLQSVLELRTEGAAAGSNAWNRAWRVFYDLDNSRKPVRQPRDGLAPEPELSIVHACPPDLTSIMPCCGRTPFEVPRSDRITVDGTVTCEGVRE